MAKSHNGNSSAYQAKVKKRESRKEEREYLKLAKAEFIRIYG